MTFKFLSPARLGLSHTSHANDSVVPTKAQRAARRDLLSTISRLSLRQGLSAPRAVNPERSRGALRSRRPNSSDATSLPAWGRPESSGPPICAGAEGVLARDGGRHVVVDGDTSLPALPAAATKRPAGALLWRDEPAAWLAALGCIGRGDPRHLSALLDSWSPLKTAQGPGSPAISIIGCLDPARLEGALRGSDDGRAARFLYAWPRPAPYRSFLEVPPCRESDAVNALQRIARAAGDPARPLALPLDELALVPPDSHFSRLHH